MSNTVSDKNKAITEHLPKLWHKVTHPTTNSGILPALDLLKLANLSEHGQEDMSLAVEIADWISYQKNNGNRADAEAWEHCYAAAHEGLDSLLEEIQRID